MTKIIVSELANILEGIHYGDGSLVIEGISTLDFATPNQVSFLTKKSERYIELAKNTNAGCVLVSSEDILKKKNVIVVDNPHLSYIKCINLFHPDEEYIFRISKNANVSPTVKLSSSVLVEDGVVIEDNCIIGKHVKIFAGAIIKKGCVVGDNCIIHSGVVMYPKTNLGRRVVIHANAVIGNDGFGYYLGGDSPVKVPHIGCVVIEDDVEIGACACVERATLTETRIGANSKLGDLVNIGHNVRIGRDTIIINQTIISGSVIIGNSCRIWGQVFIRGHLTIGDGALILAGSLVTSAIHENGKFGGRPAVPHMQWKRLVASLNNLPKLVQKIRKLEKFISSKEV